MPLHQIKHRYTDEVLFEYEVPETVESGLRTRYALEKAIDAGANLTDACLTGADLKRANLAGADLTGAYLTVADLADANLTGADLTGADLKRANLTGANLTGAKWRDGIDISKRPIQLFGLRWNVTILDQHMEIGCQLHPLHSWDLFTDEKIAEMDGDALKFWRAHKSLLLGMAQSAGRCFDPVEQAKEAA